jgi:hypothetical protein
MVFMADGGMGNTFFYIGYKNNSSILPMLIFGIL